MTSLRLTAEQSGERADAFLARSVEDLTRSAAQRLLEEGAVTVNGGTVKKNYKTVEGDLFEVTLPDPEPVDIVAQDIPLDVRYEDSDVHTRLRAVSRQGVSIAQHVVPFLRYRTTTAPSERATCGALVG